MKTTLKIIQYKDKTWGAKKKNCFGQWRYFNHECILSDGFSVTSHSWKSSPPQRIGYYVSHHDKFNSKQAIVTFLSTKYHLHRFFAEKD